jgi:hypothetical protein
MLRLLLRYGFGLIWVLLLVLPLDSAIGDQETNEVVAGSPIPIPSEMKKSTDQGMELMVPGFKGGQVAYQGQVEPREIIRFYQENMPLKDWQPYASLVTGGGLLVFTKSNKSVLIMVSENNGNTTLAILVGVMPPGQ